LLDTNGASIAGVSGSTAWRFSTKVSGPATPSASTGPTTITIGQDGAGDFATFQGAFDWIPLNNTLPRTVRVKPGIYRDNATLAGSRNFVTLAGDGASRTDVQLIYPYAYFTTPFTAGTLRIESSDVTVLNLTLDNLVYSDYHPTGETSSGGTAFNGAINTLATTGRRIVLDNVLVKGGQDTIYDNFGIVYYRNCEVWGCTDYIYGKALAVFDGCRVVQIRSAGGPITAPNTDYAQPYGLVFLNCVFPRATVADGYPYDVGVATTTLQRPWGQDGYTALINCQLDTHITTKGWSEWSGRETTCRALEYGSTMIGGGSAPTIAQRQAAGAYWLNTIDPDYTNNPSLNPTNSLFYGSPGTNNRVAVMINTNDFTLDAIFGNAYFGLGNWRPAMAPVITAQPADQAVVPGDSVTFSVGALGIPEPSYQWKFNGTDIPGATNATFTIAGFAPSDAGTYAVLAANSSGTALSRNAVLSGSQPLVPLPAINPKNVINVTTCQANVTNADNAPYIQNAINAASAGSGTNGFYGGTVEIPPGTFLCGPLTLKHNVNLRIDAGAVLRMLPFDQYPMTWHTNGSDVYFVVTANFISGNNLTNIEISGSGAIDGQGAPWWPWANTNGAVRPRMISLAGCNRELIQDVTLSNSPMFHIAISHGANSTVQRVTERANTSSDPVNPGHNTDACDITGTNTLVQFNDVSVGDDNFTCASPSSDILISNNVYGEGHGTSIGSYTYPSVSNYMVIDCTYSNTQTGAHIKTDRDRGGFVHNIRYCNLTMTNALHPIQIYCAYTNKTIPSLDSITPGVAAAFPAAAVTATTPHYRDLLISNLTAYAQSGRAAGLIWGLPESSISNVTLVNVHLTGSKTFGIYDVKNMQIIDSSHLVPAGVSQYSFFDAAVVFSNSVPATNVVTLDGATANGVANAFAFYNSLMALQNTNAIGLGSSVALDASTLIVSNHLALTPSNRFDFYLGTNASMVMVKGNLRLGGTNNIYAGGGFTSGAYTLFTYAGTLGGNLPALGTAPAGYSYAFDTNTVGQVNLIVAQSPPAPANLTATTANLAINLQWPAAAGATGYALWRSLGNGGPYDLIAGVGLTNYTDAITNPGTTYYYVVQATNLAGISGYSVQAAAVAEPSLVSPSLRVRPAGGSLQFSWPLDHVGWQLEVQTNDLGVGLGTNWTPVSESNTTNQIAVPIAPATPSTFFRLKYP
jgi:pectin methylesterase-like acyl-CoA thioesterase